MQWHWDSISYAIGVATPVILTVVAILVGRFFEGVEPTAEQEDEEWRECQ